MGHGAHMEVTVCRNGFSPSTEWALSIELRQQASRQLLVSAEPHYWLSIYLFFFLCISIHDACIHIFYESGHMSVRTQ